MNPLHNIIAEEIDAKGPMAISRFMALCLYHPVHGYYEAPDRSIGKDGDFYTSVSVGPVFGEMLAWRFARWLKEDCQPPWTLVESGAHDGRLAADILASLQRREPEILNRLRYVIIEPSAERRRRQRRLLEDHAAVVEWLDSWDAAPRAGFNGVIFSNELLDAFPVDQFGWNARDRTWFEWRVDRTDEGFSRTRGAATGRRFGALPELLEVLPDGFTIECRDAAAAWWAKAAKALQSGRMIAIDYGFEAGGAFAPARSAGTLRGYHNHRLVDDVFARPGEQDLTSHVDFGEIGGAGEACGLATEELTSQTSFLTNLLAGIEATPGSFPSWTPKRLREFQTLVHPAHLGEKFKILVQRR